MQKMLTQLECKVGEKTYLFTCDPDSPLEQVKEALFQFGKHVGSIEDAVKANRAQEDAFKETESDEVKEQEAA